MYKYILILALTFILVSCVDNTPPAAEIMTKGQLLTTPTPGYQWFFSTYNEYTPSDSVVNLIKSEFDPAKDTFLIFSKPACSCGDLAAETFARMVKVFDLANISESNYKIYSLSSSKSAHPYENLFVMNLLPTYLVTFNGLATYSIYDTIFVEKAKEKPNLRSIEEYIIRALEKN